MAADRAKAEAANGRCRSRCTAAQGLAARLTERSGKAKRRDELQAQLAAAKAKARSSGGPQATGRSLMIAAAAGGDAALIEKWIAGAMSALKIVLLETLVYLSIPGAALLGQAWTGTGQSRTARGSRRSAGGPRGGHRTALDDRRVVRLHAPSIEDLAASGLSQSEIASRTGVSKSTVQRRLAAMRLPSAQAAAQ